MKFYSRHDNGWGLVEITKLYEGATAFLIGGAPTLTTQPRYRELERPDIVSFGLNNVCTYIRTKYAIMSDHGGCYNPGIISDPSVQKLFKRNLYKDVSSKAKNILYFDATLGDTFDNIYGQNAVTTEHNNGLEIAIGILLGLGFKTIVLCGMTMGKAGYVDTALPTFESAWNERLYQQQIKWLLSKAGEFKKRGIKIIDTSVSSKLAGAYDTMTLSTALDKFGTPVIAPCKVQHATAFYQDIDKSRIPVVEKYPPLSVPIFNACEIKNFDDFETRISILLTLGYYYSLNRTNPGTQLFLCFDCPDSIKKAITLLTPDLDVHWCRLSDETKNIIPIQDIRGISVNIRCFLPRIFKSVKSVKEIISMDTDMIIQDDLRLMVNECRRVCFRDNTCIAGAEDVGMRHYKFRHTSINGGLVYIDLDKARATGIDSMLEKKCIDYSDVKYIRRDWSDQEAFRDTPHSMISQRWNATPLTMCNPNLYDASDYAELQETAGVYHYITWKKRIFSKDNSTPHVVARKEIALALDKLRSLDAAIANQITDFRFFDPLIKGTLDKALA